VNRKGLVGKAADGVGSKQIGVESKGTKLHDAEKQSRGETGPEPEPQNADREDHDVESARRPKLGDEAGHKKPKHMTARCGDGTKKELWA